MGPIKKPEKDPESPESPKVSIEGYTKEVVETAYGTITVLIKGDRSKTPLFTYHDLALNSLSNYKTFFNYPDMSKIAENFCVFHINAPGQEEGASQLPYDFSYPTMEELAEQVNNIVKHYGLKKYVGIGVGLGANVLLRHALEYPENVDCLLVINAVSTAPGWIEWGFQKRNVSHLRRHGVTKAVIDYLMWHHFGSATERASSDLHYVYEKRLEADVIPFNLAMLIERYIWRTGIPLERGTGRDSPDDNECTLQVPVLNMVGSYSPYVDDTVTLNGKLTPSKTNWIKLQDSAMLVEEQPAKVAEAFRLFLQGQGFCLNVPNPSVPSS